MSVSSHLIAGRFAPEPGRSAPHLSPLLGAVLARDAQDDAEIAALRVARNAPARPAPIALLSADDIPNLLAPLACGVSGDAVWVMVRPPPGPSLLIQDRRWTEVELLRRVLRPAVIALEALAQRGLTHRAIRPDNLFISPAGTVVLGPAWSAPPASQQPCPYEPTYSALCPPAARGDGSIADDIYALGVVLLRLALGHEPMAGLDDNTVLWRKLELGSFAALTAEAELPASLAELLSAMLADDPEHRPTPAMLRDPAAGRSRRVPSRTPRPANIALKVADVEVWSNRSLALALIRHPEQGSALLRAGTVTRWLRRSLADPVRAQQLDDELRNRSRPGDRRAEAMQMMRAVALIDPLAPLCWRGLLLWPDGIGPLVADLHASQAQAGASDRTALLTELLAAEAIAEWTACRSQRPDLDSLRAQGRSWRLLLEQRAPEGGLPRLAYALNPWLACQSPSLGRRVVLGPADTLQALEAAALNADRKQPPLDRELRAFLAARDATERGDEYSILDCVSLDPQLFLLVSMQQRLRPGPLPALAGWLSECGLLDLAAWNSRLVRNALEKRLPELLEAGMLRDLVQTLLDRKALLADQRAAEAARTEAKRIDASLATSADGRAACARDARRIGRDLASGVGLMLGLVVLASVLL